MYYLRKFKNMFFLLLHCFYYYQCSIDTAFQDRKVYRRAAVDGTEINVFNESIQKRSCYGPKLGILRTLLD